MTEATFFDGAVSQVWQIAALIVIVGFAVRLLARRRPHLAHALWLVVLLKCVTPPVVSSPTGIFSWVQRSTPPIAQAAPEPAADAPTATEATDSSPAVDRAWRGGGQSFRINGSSEESHAVASGAADAMSGHSADTAAIQVEDRGLETAGTRFSTAAWRAANLGTVLLVSWGIGTMLVIGVALVRVAACVRRLRRSGCRSEPAIDAALAALAHRLGLRRRVRLLITDSRVGPAVLGLVRPTILLPACVVAGKTPGQLEPILAHELIHVRRGDLWVGLLQIIAQGLWWFHPLVWLAGRRLSREAERCCDEEVIGSLGCPPAHYARSLLDVLELKRVLTPVPAFPGMRPVQLTSQRLERIMSLGQGCRPRAGWRVWVALLVFAAVALPGAGLVTIAAEEPSAAESAVEPAQATIVGQGVNSDAGLIGTITPDAPESPAAPTPNTNAGTIGEIEMIDGEPTPDFRAYVGRKIKEVRIQGTQTDEKEVTLDRLKTRAETMLDLQEVESDLLAIYNTGRFGVGDPTAALQADGTLEITFNVYKYPPIRFVRIFGDAAREATWLKVTGLKKGAPLNPEHAEAACERLATYLHSHDFPEASVELLEGDYPDDRGIKMAVFEEPETSISYDINGNMSIPSERLMRYIDMRKEFDLQQVRADAMEMMHFYHDLGFFRAQVSHEWDYDEKESCPILRFKVDEGARFVVNKVSTGVVVAKVTVDGKPIVGDDQDLLDALKIVEPQLALKAGDFFEKMVIDRDIDLIKEKCGELGYVFAFVECSSGLLDDAMADASYSIQDEGRYKLGKIKLSLQGKDADARRSAILDRLTIRPGDRANTKKLREAERRLKAATGYAVGYGDNALPKYTIHGNKATIAATDPATLSAGESIEIELVPENPELLELDPRRLWPTDKPAHEHLYSYDARPTEPAQNAPR